MALADKSILFAVLAKVISGSSGKNFRTEGEVTVPTCKGYDSWAQIYDSEDNPLVSLEERFLPGLIGINECCAGLKNIKMFSESALKGNTSITGSDKPEILDFGCGTGRWSVPLALAGAKVTGVDFSPGMLEKAKAKARANGAEVQYLLHDLNTVLPFADSSFDLVLSCLALEHFQSLKLPFSQIARVCRSGGRVIITAMHPAMMLLGIEARFTDPVSGQRVYPASARHEICDYFSCSRLAGLNLNGLYEYPADAELAKISRRAEKYLGWPLLLIMDFILP